MLLGKRVDGRQAAEELPTEQSTEAEVPYETHHFLSAQERPAGSLQQSESQPPAGPRADSDQRGERIKAPPERLPAHPALHRVHGQADRLQRRARRAGQLPRHRLLPREHDEVVDVLRVQEGPQRRRRLLVHERVEGADPRVLPHDELVDLLARRQGQRPPHGQHPQHRVHEHVRRDALPQDLAHAKQGGPDRLEAEELPELGRELHGVERHLDVRAAHCDAWPLVRVQRGEGLARREGDRIGALKAGVGDSRVDHQSLLEPLLADRKGPHAPPRLQPQLNEVGSKEPAEERGVHLRPLA